MGLTMKTTGLDELGSMLEELGSAAPGIAAASLYEGAGVMADAVSQGIGTIQTARRRHKEPGGRLPTPEEKAVLSQAASGIAKFRKNGSEVSTSVGFDNAGYASLGGQTVPIPKIANAINSGTSFMKKQPFFRRAVSRATGPAKAAIVAKGEEMVTKITK